MCAKSIIFLSCLLSLGAWSVAAALEQPDNWLFTECLVSPAYAPLDRRPALLDNFTNNLLQSPESSFTASGKHIEVRGRVYDKECVPVANVKIILWQADQNGIYPKPKNSDSDFTYNGVTESDNNGHFIFYTLLPGTRNKLPPALNVAVQHEDFPNFTSQFFFNVPLTSETLPKWNKLDEVQRIRLLLKEQPADEIGKEKGALPIYYMDIILPNVQLFKYYG